MSYVVQKARDKRAHDTVVLCTTILMFLVVRGVVGGGIVTRVDDSSLECLGQVVCEPRS